MKRKKSSRRPELPQPPPPAAAPGGTGVLETAGAGTTNDLGTIREDVERARGILTEAMRKLAGNLRGVDDEALAQRRLMNELLGRLSRAEADGDAVPGISVRTFARETHDVLQQFTDLLATISKQSIKTVYRIDDMAEELDAVFKLVASINEIAEETFMLAVNATIEAAHAGNAGRSFSVIAGNVRELSKKTRRFNEQIGAQIGKAKNTVNEVRSIISEMASRDLNVALAGKERVQEMLGEIEAFEEFVASSLSRAAASAQRMIGDSASAVAALGFEEVLSELLLGTERRIARIAALAGPVERRPEPPTNERIS